MHFGSWFNSPPPKGNWIKRYLIGGGSRPLILPLPRLLAGVFFYLPLFCGAGMTYGPCGASFGFKSVGAFDSVLHVRL